MSFSSAWHTKKNDFKPSYLPGQGIGMHGTFANPIRELHYSNGETQYFAIMQPDPLQTGYYREARAAIPDTQGWTYIYTFGGMTFALPKGRPALYKQFDMSNVSDTSSITFFNDADDTILATYGGSGAWLNVGPYDTDGGANAIHPSQNTQYLRDDDPDDGATASSVIRIEWRFGHEGDYITFGGPGSIDGGSSQTYHMRADNAIPITADLGNLFFKMVNPDYTNLYSNEEYSSSPPYQSFYMGFSTETKPANGFT